jgi:hypothetical protein
MLAAGEAREGKMMKSLKLIAAALVALQSVASPAAPPASDAYIDRFLATVPDIEKTRIVDRAADPEDLARLTELNPGRADEIRPILETYTECISVIVNAGTIELIRNAARGLGEARAMQMAAFYRSPDSAVFAGLIERTNKGEALSDAESARLGAILARYPISQFNDQMKKLTDAMPEDQALVTAMTRCSLAKKQAFIEGKIRYN